MNLDFHPNDESEIFAKIENLQSLAIAKKKKVACIISGIKHSGNPEYQTFGGFNIEFSSSDVIHAERMALVSCVSEGFYPSHLYVTSSRSEGNPVYMCGNCRQLFSEVNEKMDITVFNPDGMIKGRTTLNKVFPNHKDSTKKNKMFKKYCSVAGRFDLVLG